MVTHLEKDSESRVSMAMNAVLQKSQGPDLVKPLRRYDQHAEHLSRLLDDTKLTDAMDLVEQVSEELPVK
jgi:hypothetical protein